MARIGIDARLTYYTQGGISQYTQHLLRELPELAEDHSIAVLHSRKDERDLAGAPMHRVSCWTPSHHRLERLALGLEIAPRRLDLLHSPDFIPPLFGAGKFVITVHDLAFLHYPQFLTPESRHYYNGQIAAAAQRADRIIAVSEATCRDLTDLLEVPPDKIDVILEGVTPNFRPLPPADLVPALEKYRLTAGYILFVSTLEPRKNVSGLIRAYAALRAALPDAPPLVLVGDQGWLSEPVLGLIEKLRLGAHVRWLGRVSYDMLPALYAAAGVFCLPSFYEGFGLPPLEAMACGTPVVVSQRASLPEVVGEAGLLVNPDDDEEITDTLRRVLTDPELAAEMRQKGLTQAGKFSWRRAAEETLAVYERTLAE